MSSTSETKATQPTKLCFVTVGATAPFLGLLLSVFSPDFMEALSQAGYTHLLIQYGQNGQIYYENFLTRYPPGSPERHGIEIDGFDFNPAGLKQEMRMAQINEPEGRRGGLIISHAGNYYPGIPLLSPLPDTGCRIWDHPRSNAAGCTTCGCSEPNSQEQPSDGIGQRAAEAGLCLGKRIYVCFALSNIWVDVFANHSTRHVSNAVAKAEALRSQPLARPPIQGPNKRRTRTLEEVLSDEMGFLD